MSLEEISNKVVNINPEPIGIFTLPNEKHIKYKKTLQKIMEDTPKDSDLVSSDRHAWRLCHNYDQHIFETFETLSDLEEDIHSVLLSYIRNTGYVCDKMIINDAWCNMDSKNSTLGFHYHTNSYLSGTYYVNYDIKNHTPLSFINDRITANRKGPGIEIPENLNVPTIYNKKLVTIPIKEGSILIWKSHLTHGFTQPNKEGNRLTLSFNAMPKTCRNTLGHYSFSITK